jgi:hypothetical protein
MLRLPSSALNSAVDNEKRRRGGQIGELTDILAARKDPDRSHVLNGEEGRVERNADLVEDVARQSALAVCGFALVDLSLLRCLVL